MGGVHVKGDFELIAITFDHVDVDAQEVDDAVGTVTVVEDRRRFANVATHARLAHEDRDVGNVERAAVTDPRDHGPHDDAVAGPAGRPALDGQGDVHQSSGSSSSPSGGYGSSTDSTGITCTPRMACRQASASSRSCTVSTTPLVWSR